MNGTPKQNDWAEEIRDRIAAEMPDMSSNPIAAKAGRYILSINSAEFWIEHKSCDVGTMLRSLIGSGLPVRGSGFSDQAKMDQTTGEITVTRNVIVADGRGGHEEEQGA